MKETIRRAAYNPNLSNSSNTLNTKKSYYKENTVKIKSDLLNFHDFFRSSIFYYYIVHRFLYCQRLNLHISGMK